MWASPVVEDDVAPVRCACLRDVCIGVQVDLLIFDCSPEPFDEDIVAPGAFSVYYRQCIGKANVTRGMLILISRLASTSMKSAEVNWLPWSAARQGYAKHDPERGC
jgi:hypothetical protein